MRLIAVLAVVGFVAPPVLAFQEGTVGGNSDKPATPVLEAPKDGGSGVGKGIDLKVPGVSLGGQGSGTEVRIPGFGKVGVLPKLDFGLELLYGATESRTGRPEEKSEPNDVQIRGTIKHRF
jgi:hypothetical protein